MTYLKLYCRNLHPISKMSDEDSGKLFKALIQYAEDGTAEDFDGTLGFAFDMLKEHIDMERETYDRMVARAKACADKKRSRYDFLDDL